MDKIASGEADWTFVEIMGCPGGCVNGDGQPIQPQSVRDTVCHDGLLEDNRIHAKALAKHYAAFPNVVGFQIE